jgi:sugar lactone lactonase YvrE
MIWKWDETTKSLSKFLPCSGLIGPGATPENIDDYVEGGSNGLSWGWKGSKDLLICQHGKHRIVRINIDDVDENGEIDPDLVTVLVDSYNGTAFNSPNDMYLDGDNLDFTDPPFGNQFFSSDDPIASAFKALSQDIGVYVISGDPEPNTPVEPERIINFGDPGPVDWHAPNGVAVSNKGTIFVAVTDFTNPRFHVYEADVVELDIDPIGLFSNYTINNNTNGFPDLTDGVTYSPGLDIFFASGPAGIYIYDGTTCDLLGFLRLDDLCSNNVLGGGYLWMAVNTRLMRIP